MRRIFVPKCVLDLMVVPAPRWSDLVRGLRIEVDGVADKKISVMFPKASIKMRGDLIALNSFLKFIDYCSS